MTAALWRVTLNGKAGYRAINQWFIVGNLRFAERGFLSGAAVFCCSRKRLTSIQYPAALRQQLQIPLRQSSGTR